MNAAQKLGTHFPQDLLKSTFGEHGPRCLHSYPPARIASLDQTCRMHESFVNKLQRGLEWAAMTLAGAMTALKPRFHRSTSAEDRFQVATLKAENAKLLEENTALHRLATTDSLTGLPNRRAFLAAAKLELARMARSGERACVVLADVDFFKTINDRFGHATGDQVLQVIAQTLRASLRTVDIIACWGEEMIFLLPETECLGAWNVAEKCRRTIESRLKPTQQAVTMTFGVSSLHLGEDIELAIKRADTALYIGKLKGRNRTELAV
jgi:diguanylate cyclase (GGDEF)-like protein